MIKKLSDTHALINGLVYGGSGVGKTTLAGTMGGNVLIISAESGLLCLQGKALDVIDVAKDEAGALVPVPMRHFRLVKILDYIEKNCIGKYDWLFFDSLSEMLNNLIEGLQASGQFNDPKNKFALWGEYAKYAKELVKRIRDLPFNVVCTSLDKQEKDENGNRFFNFQVAGSIQDQLPAYFDEVFYMYVDAEGARHLITSRTPQCHAKDRSGKLDKIEKPDMAAIRKKILAAPQQQPTNIKETK